MRALKFLVAGSIGLGVNLGVYYVLYELRVPYLMGSIVAFFVAMVVGFVLQKYWTFKDRTSERTHAQFALYAALAFGNLAINTHIVFVLVEHAKVYYLVAQTIGTGSVAIISYFAYTLYIFTDAPESA